MIQDLVKIELEEHPIKFKYRVQLTQRQLDTILVWADNYLSDLENQIASQNYHWATGQMKIKQLIDIKQVRLNIDTMLAFGVTVVDSEKEWNERTYESDKPKELKND